MVKDTDFKFDTHLLRDNTDMTPQIFFSKRAWSGSHDPYILGGVNANSSKMVKATDFKFDTHLLMDKTDMTTNFFSKRAWPGSRDP